VTIVLPTKDRPQRVALTVARLLQQRTEAELDIVVVDDGSRPPIPEWPDGPVRVLRTPGVERSAARNLGAAASSGDVLIFLDDDIEVPSDFVDEHLRAHDRHPGTLVVGRLGLPASELHRPFCRFREELEQAHTPGVEGLVTQRTFCTSANMSISRAAFEALGGFDPRLISAEDQDLALRHTAQGGRIVYWPRAMGVHWDTALTLRSYCERARSGARGLVEFAALHPALPDTTERDLVNGPIRWQHEPLRLSVQKLAKNLLWWSLARTALFAGADVAERVLPRGGLAESLYRAALGVHLRRGHQEGLAERARSRS
jgi:GT2 family glycosyltransferase